MLEAWKRAFGVKTPIEIAEIEAYEKEALHQAKERGKRRAKQEYKNDKK